MESVADTPQRKHLFRTFIRANKKHVMDCLEIERMMGLSTHLNGPDPTRVITLYEETIRPTSF